MVLIDDNMTSLLFQNDRNKQSDNTMSTLSKSVVTSRKHTEGKFFGSINMNIRDYLNRPNINMRNLKSQSDYEYEQDQRAQDEKLLRDRAREALLQNANKFN